MYCKKCGNQLSAQNTFCPKCGTPVSGDARRIAQGQGSRQPMQRGEWAGPAAQQQDVWPQAPQPVQPQRPIPSPPQQPVPSPPQQPALGQEWNAIPSPPQQPRRGGNIVLAIIEGILSLGATVAFVLVPFLTITISLTGMGTDLSRSEDVGSLWDLFKTIIDNLGSSSSSPSSYLDGYGDSFLSSTEGTIAMALIIVFLVLAGVTLLLGLISTIRSFIAGSSRKGAPTVAFAILMGITLAYIVILLMVGLSVYLSEETSGMGVDPSNVSVLVLPTVGTWCAFGASVVAAVLEVVRKR